MTAKKKEELEVQRPIWEMLAELGQSTPSEAFNDLPRDFSINFEHYMYGHPKEKE